ncbi:MAG: hypothetical protein ACM3S5_10655 [Rhodospirillales bacterium]
MLVPWLAAGIENPLSNLLVQSQVHCLAAVAVVLLFAALCGRSHSVFSFSVLMQAQLLLALAIASLRATSLSMGALLLAHTFLLSLALGLAALLFSLRLRPRSKLRAVATVGVLCLVAFWLNVSVFPFCGLAIVLAPGWREPGEWRWRFLLAATMTAAFVCVRLLQSAWPGPAFLGWSSPLDLPAALLQIGQNISGWVLYPRRVCVILALGLAPWLLQRRLVSPPSARNGLRWTVCFSAVGLLLLTACSSWAKGTGYTPRLFVVPVCLLLLSAYLPLVESATWLFRPDFARGWVVITGTSLALVVFSTAVFGFPSPRAARETVLSTTSSDSEEIRDLGCTHLIGSYWNVWPRVFHHLATSDAPIIWGVTFRSDVTRRLWDGYPQESRVYCAVANDPEVQLSASSFKVPPLAQRACKGNICSFTVH